VPRPAAAAAAAAPAEADDAPKLLDAFSALLAAEEGGGAVAAEPVEMEGAPAPGPPPAVQWTPGQTVASVETAAETVVLQAVTADAVEAAGTIEAAAAPSPVQAAAVAEAVAVDEEPVAAETPRDEPPALAAVATPAALRADPPQAALDGIDVDEFADVVAQKILHRLTDARIDAIVSERVLEIAERLVREEIDRIKADAQ